MKNIKESEKLYLDAKVAYYAGNPIMSDFEFDVLEDELKAAGSNVTSIVGTPGKVKGSKAKHWSPMLSLNKIQALEGVESDSIAEFQNWSKDHPSTMYEASPKFDGNAINLQYVDGQLQKAITRGDKNEGQDVTLKLKLLVPNKISISGNVEIRGEIVMPNAVFESKYAADYANPRNFVAGIVNRDEITQSLKECHFLAYDVRIYNGNILDFPADTIVFLDSNGFKSFPVRTFHNYTKYFDVYQYFKKWREESPYALDGMVIKTHEFTRLQLGESGHSPKWAIAIKFPPKETLTQIESIEWSVGTHGEITPIGILKPVLLDGTTVKRVLLHNVGMMVKNGTLPGATINLVKSGDIIPMVKSVIKKSNTPIAIPTQCPSCGSKLVQNDIHLECHNFFCDAQQERKLNAAISIFGLKGFGPSTVIKLRKAGVKSIIEFFNPSILSASNLKSSGRFTDSAIETLVDSYNAIGMAKTEDIIRSLQFKGCGNTISLQLAKWHHGAPHDFSGFDKNIIHEFTKKGSTQYALFLQLVKSIQAVGIKVLEPVEKTGVGIGVELTGSPKDFGFKTKEEFLTKIGQHGYFHTDLKNASILLTDSYTSSSSKMGAARKASKQILTYSDFLAGLK